MVEVFGCWRGVPVVEPRLCPALACRALTALWWPPPPPPPPPPAPPGIGPAAPSHRPVYCITPTGAGRSPPPLRPRPRPAPPGARRSMWVTHSAVLLEGKSRFIVLASLHCSAHATSALFIWYTIPDVLARYPETKSDNVTPVVARILIVEMMISSDMHS